MTNAIGAIDKTLHDERVTLTKEKKTFKSPLSQLPLGVMFEMDGSAYLHWHQGALLWTPSGYKTPKIDLSESGAVKVLTPLSIVRAMQAGYIPQVHGSAGS